MDGPADDGRFACATTHENDVNNDDNEASYSSFCSPTHLLEKIENLTEESYYKPAN